MHVKTGLDTLTYSAMGGDSCGLHTKKFCKMCLIKNAKIDFTLLLVNQSHDWLTGDLNCWSITTWLIYWWPVVSHLSILDWYIDELAYVTNMMFTPITDTMESQYSLGSTWNKGFLTSSLSFLSSSTGPEYSTMQITVQCSVVRNDHTIYSVKNLSSQFFWDTLYNGMELITGGQGVMDHTPQSQTCICINI